MKSKKEITEKKNSQKNLKNKTMEKSPSKSQLSSTSTIGTLNLQQVVYNTIGNKDKRAEEDKSFRWPTNEVQSSLVEKLRKKLYSAIDPHLLDYMFATNFKKNLEAVSILNEHLKSEFTSMCDIMDLIFKWLTIKMVDQSNTATNKAIMELLRNFFTELANTEYMLRDFEAAAILPMLCERTSIGNTALREEVKELIQQSCSIYSNTKVAGFLVKALESKNPKTRNECLLLIKDFLKKYGSKVIQPKDIKPISKLLATADNSAKQEILEILAEIYITKGNQIWGLTGPLPEVQKEMIKQKFSQIDQEKADEAKPLIDNGVATENESLKLPLDTSTICAEPPSIADNQFEDQKNNMDFSVKPSPDVALKKQEDEKSNNLDSIPPIKKMEQNQEQIKFDSLEECLELMRNGNISKKADALVFLNEKTALLLEQNKEILASNCNIMFTTFASVLKEIFDKTEQDIPIRFAKFFLSAVNKICGVKAILKDEESIKILIEQLLSKLIYEGLDKVGENKEGEFIIKILNSATIRMLENCNATKILIVLIRLFDQYKNAQANTGKFNLSKMPGLIINSMTKLTKILDPLIPNIDASKFLLCCYNHMITANLQPKSSNEDFVIRIIKSIINKIVKSKQEGIWVDYEIIKKQDKPDDHIKRWIISILKSIHAGDSNPGNAEQIELQPSKSVIQAKELSTELMEIFKELNSQTTFQNAIKRLSECISKHPSIDLNQYFGSCSKAFTKYVLNSLQEHNSQIKQDLGYSNIKHNDSKHADCRAKTALLTLKKPLGAPSTQDDAQPHISPYQTQQFAQTTTISSSTAEIFNKINKYKKDFNKKP